MTGFGGVAIMGPGGQENISQAEVKRAVDKLKIKISPGVDDLYAEIIMWSGKSIGGFMEDMLVNMGK